MLTEAFDPAASEEGKVLQVFHTGISIPSPVASVSHVIGCFFSFVAIFLVVVSPTRSMSSTCLCLGASWGVVCTRSDSMLHWLTFIKTFENSSMT